MGRQINQSIVIDARVQTTLEGMEEVVSKLNKELREGTTKVDLTKGIGASLSKNIEKFKEEFSRFSKLTEGGKVEFGDSKDAIKSGENLIKTFRELKRIVGDFDDLSVLDAKRLFPDAFDSRVGELLKGLNGLSAAMGKLETKRLDLSSAESELETLRAKADEFQKKMDQEITAKTNLDKAQEALREFDEEIDKIRKKASEGISLKIETSKRELSEAEAKKQQIEEARVARGFSSADFIGSKANNPQYRGKTVSAWTKQLEAKNGSAESKAEAEAALKAIRLYHQEEEALTSLGQAISEKAAQVKKLEEALARVGKMKLTEAVEVSGGSQQDKSNAEAAQQMRDEAKAAEEEAAAAHRLATTQAKGAQEGWERTTKAIEEQKGKIDKLKIEVGNLEKEVSPEALEKAFSTAGVEGFSAEMLRSKEGIEQLRQKLEALDQEKLDELKQQFINMGLSSDQAEEYIKQLRGTVDGVGDSALGIKKATSEIDNLKNSVLQFFSLTNAVQLFKRAVTSALNTVKELDATMTEAAVVTDFSVGDMWNKLPQYSAQAQKLGVSINGMYQATTLYYQQGLKTNEAMQLGIETMKMAKIAGMESAEATTAMTAALRGFNMELNETSATRVNDVYSQLAAVTAADTEQIATAMSKTASIAASANMEFETTAALLAQIIETTQEAPETAGTAMKTIIARFSEAKNLRDKGAFSGQDDEGEEIDVNKIQTALRSVGISMNGFFEGTESLGSVLLELSKKWDTLDFETQRYIATMAAGSRQQSRFIAMMSDYKRTQELVTEANASSGASQEQFNKTLDSMETKLQKLKNAWNQFLMGLANNEILKTAVDLLISIIEIINKMVGGIDGKLGGFTKTITSLIMAISAIKIGKKVLGTGFDWIGEKLGLPSLNQTKEFGRQTGKSFQEGMAEGQQQSQQPQQTTLTSTQSNTPTSTHPPTNNVTQTPQAQGWKQPFGANVEQGWGSFKQSFSSLFGGGLKKEIKESEEAIKKLQEFNPGEQRSKTIKDRMTALSNAHSNGQAAFDQKWKDYGLSEEYLEEYKKRFKNMPKDKNRWDILTELEAETKGAAFLTETEAAEDPIAANQAAIAAEQQKKLQKELELTTLKQQQMTQGAKVLGGALIGVGTVLGIVSQKLEEAGETEAAENVAEVAGWFTTIGAVLATLPSIIAGVKAAWLLFNAAVSTTGGFVTLIIVAVVALTALVVGLFTSKEDKLSKQLEKAKEATEAAKEAAEKAKQAYNDLLSGHGEYNELQNQLEALTAGTAEWNQALLESNQQVLGLLEKYSELQNYLTVGKNGELVLGEAAWREAEKMAMESAQKSQVVWFSEQIREIQLEEKSAWKHTLEEMSQNGAATNNAEYLYEQFLADPEKFNNDEWIDKQAKRTGNTKSQIENSAKYFADYKARQQGLQNRITSLGTSAVSQFLSSEARDSEVSDDVLASFGNLFSSGVQEAQIDKMAEDLTASTNTGKIKEIAEKYGINLKSGGKSNRLKNLQEIYAKVMGIQVDEIGSAIKEDAEALARQIAQAETTSEYGIKAESFIKKMQGKNKEVINKTSAVLSGQGGALGFTEAGKIASTDTAILVEETAKALGYTKSRDMALDLGKTNTDFKDMTQEARIAYLKYLSKTEDGKKRLENYITETDEDGNIDYDWAAAAQDSDFYGETITAEVQLIMDTEHNKKIIQEQEDKVKEIFADKGLDSTTYAEGKTLTVMTQVSNQIKNMGKEDAAAYLAEWNKLLPDMQDYLSTIDWSNMSEANQAMEYMQKQGLDSSETEKFWKAATDGANVYVKSVAEVDNLTKQFQKSNKNTDEAMKRLTEGTGTAEDINLLKSVGLDMSKNLHLTAEGWQVVGLNIEEATAQLKKYNAETAKANLQIHRDTMAEYQEWASNGMGAGHYIKYDEETGKYTFDSEESRRSEGHFIDVGMDMGVERTAEDTDETYAEKVRKEFQNRVNGLNDNIVTDAMYTETVEFTEVESRQADLDAGAAALNKNWEKWTESGDYKEIEKETKRMLGTTQDLGDEFVKNAKNLDLIKKAAEGDEEALKELRKAATTQIFKDLGKEGEQALGRVKDDIEAVAEAEIDVGVTVTLDTGDKNYGIAERLTNIYNEAYQAVLMGTGDVEKAMAAGNAAIAAEGYATTKMVPDLAAETITVKGQLPPGYSYESGDTYTDETTGAVFTGIKPVANEPGIYTYTTTRLVPKENTGYTRVSSTVGGGSSSNKGGGGGGSKYKNSHDKLYNTYEKINAIIRERESLERRYNKILEDRTKSVKELLENSRKQISVLKEEGKLQTYVRDQKAQEIKDLMSENSKYDKYVTGFDETTGTISINWEEFNKIKDSEKGSEVDEYLSKLEGLRDQWREAQDKIEEIDDTVEEIKNQGKDQYLEFEEKTKEAIINAQQKEIDKLSEIHDSINDTNSKIIDSMQEQIDAYRQARDNEKTEEELSDKQRRLAYLQQDTSGANAAEILSLQKEIEEGQESYTDQLIDQKISELQKQNDKAAEQREEQIQILEHQLEQYQESGAIWKEVSQLWAEGVDEDGQLKSGSRLEALLKSSEEFSSMSTLGKEVWLDELAQTIKSATSWDQLQKTPEEEPQAPTQTQTKSNPYGDASSSGSSLKSMQWALKELYKEGKLKNDVGEIDGLNGPKTRAAMREFQQMAKNDKVYTGTVDGVAGSLTRKAFKYYGYQTGGLADFTGPAWLDGTKSKPEYILNADQTKAFFKLVDVLGSLQTGDFKTAQNSGDTSFDVDINVESIGSDYDVERLANTIKRLINDDARYRNNNAISLMR